MRYLDPLNVADVIDGWELEERRRRALSILLNRGADNAPDWVWELVDSWDMAR
jgi:hypothetical protein